MTARIIFVNRFFFPDESATSQMVSDLTFSLAAKGCEIAVVTSAGSYSNFTDMLPPHEIVRGVTIWRVGGPRSKTQTMFSRSIGYLELYWRLAWAVFRRSRRGDILVVMTDPPLLSVILAPVAKLLRLKLVNWLQDLYPEVAERLGVGVATGRMGRALRELRDSSLRAADLNVTIGDGMSEYLIQLGLSKEKLTVIHNWCDDENLRPDPIGANELRFRWGLNETFIVGYSGNFGRAHEYHTVLAAAELLRKTGVVFLFIGSGHLIPTLQKAITARGLVDMFQFRPYQDRAMLSQSLSLPDLHWLSLIPAMEGLIVPSKFYGIAAVAKPMIAVTDQDGEVARLLRAHGAGVSVSPGDGKAFAETILRLMQLHEVRTELGRNARQMLEREYAASYAYEKWYEKVECFERLNGRD